MPRRAALRTTTTGTRRSRWSRARRPGRVVHVRLPGPACRELRRRRRGSRSPRRRRPPARAGRGDALVVQGVEAGGHRGSWVDDARPGSRRPARALQLIDADVPLVATGGIATRAGVAAALAAGAAGRAARHGVPARARGRHVAGAPRRGSRRGADRCSPGRSPAGRRAGSATASSASTPTRRSPTRRSTTHGTRAPRGTAGDAEGVNLWAGQAHPLATAGRPTTLTRWLAGA